MQFKLLIINCRAQLAFQFSARVDNILHLAIEKTQHIPAGSLGLIHGNIRLLQQFFYVPFMLVEQGGANAGRAVVFVSIKLVELPQ